MADFPVSPSSDTGPAGVNSPANHGPEDYADMANGLAKILANVLMKTENMIPARVVQYDRVKNIASVQPLINIVMTGGSFPRGVIGPIPVFAAGAGNFVMSFPIKEGDLGWILANDRDITAFIESLKQGDPATFRTHSFNDAVLFPDAIRNFTTTGEDGNMVIQTLDGTVRISLGATQVKVTHPTKVLLDTPLVECLKDLNVGGGITAQQDITTQTEVKAGAIGLKAHHHTAQGATAPTTPAQA